jgi:hypothetical protein
MLRDRSVRHCLGSATGRATAVPRRKRGGRTSFGEAAARPRSAASSAPRRLRRSPPPCKPSCGGPSNRGAPAGGQGAALRASRRVERSTTCASRARPRLSWPVAPPRGNRDPCRDPGRAVQIPRRVEVAARREGCRRRLSSLPPPGPPRLRRTPAAAERRGSRAQPASPESTNRLSSQKGERLRRLPVRG